MGTPDLAGFSDQIKDRRSFVKESVNTQDECGHGTHATALLLRVAPGADIYIAQISRTGDLCNPMIITEVSSNMHSKS